MESASGTRSRASRPRELNLSLGGSVRSGGSKWYLRGVRFYADPAMSRFRAILRLERPETDASGVALGAEPAPLAAPHQLLAVELVGEGRTPLEAAAGLVAQLLTSELLGGDDDGR